MASIFAKISSLIQYLTEIKLNPELLRPERCPYCGKFGVWFHGSYPRKVDRSSSHGQSLNPVFIQRFFCPHCRRTCSILPGCIPPRRWYLWEAQQAVLILLLAEKSLYAIAKELAPSRHTIGRWLHRFKKQFCLYKDALCNHFTDLGRMTGFTHFWDACLKKLSLAEAMRLCHVAGVPVP